MTSPAVLWSTSDPTPHPVATVNSLGDLKANARITGQTTSFGLNLTLLDRGGDTLADSFADPDPSTWEIRRDGEPLWEFRGFLVHTHTNVHGVDTEWKALRLTSRPRPDKGDLEARVTELETRLDRMAHALTGGTT